MVLAALLSALGLVGADADETHTLLHGGSVPGHPTLQAGGSRVGFHAEVPLRFSDPIPVPAAEFATPSRDFYAEMIETDWQVVRHGDERGHRIQRRRVGDRGADAAGERTLVIAADGSSDACSIDRRSCSVRAERARYLCIHASAGLEPLCLPSM